MIQDSNDNSLTALKSPINEWILKISGLYLVICLLLSIVSNSILLLVFIRLKKLRTPLNLIIFSTCLINLVGSIEIPLMVFNIYNNKLIWTELICLVTGLVHNLIRTLQIYLITALSFLRFFILRQANKSKFLSKKKTVLVTLVTCFGLSILCSVGPLVGWSSYSVDHHLISFSITYDDNSINAISYKVCLLLMTFLFPICLMTYTNWQSILMVRGIRKLVPSIKYLGLLKRDRKVTIGIIIYISGFVLARTPYMLVILTSTFKRMNLSLTYIAYFSLLIANSSFFLSTFTYMLFNKNIRSKINKNLCNKSDYFRLLNKKEFLNEIAVNSYATQMKENPRELCSLNHS